MHQSGTSALELLVVLVIVGILVTAAAPGLAWIALDARRTADVNAFVTAIQLARSESAKRARSVVLCKSADLSTCGGSEVRYDSGWIVFVDLDADTPPQRDPGEPLVFGYRPVSEGTIRSNRPRYTFRPYYRRSTNGTVTFCDRRGAEAARAVIVSYTGRPRVSDRGPGDRALTCAS